MSFCYRAFHIVALAAAIFLVVVTPASAQRQFGFDNRKPSGQPYLKPEETVKRFRVSPGYEAKLFAGEPDVINPIAFTIDEKGRVWVLENFEYPKRTPPGKKPRDRIKILEDTNGDGRADKVTIWAEGKTLPIGWELASGLEVGHGGVFLGAPPYLFFLQDTDGDGKCDKQEVLLKGFGSHDTHETLNTFQWGPDSRLYGLHGVFTRSTVNGVKLNAAVWRYDVGAKKFEVFAEGTSNPWGMDFDSYGQCHLTCCVIPHLFHMVPGGRYIRQAGASFNPYTYGLLQQSCDHTHHRESGWAHAGLLFLDGDHVPKAYRGSLIMGSIHGCSIKRDVLRRAGSTYLAGHAADFVVSGDKNFRPINLRWGPDGSIYVIDWHDQNPCHQAKPDSWDKTRGRIYRLVPKAHRQRHVGQIDLSKATSKQLVAHLKNDNPWWYRTALRLLSERRDRSVVPQLQQLTFESKNEKHALRGLWALCAVGAFDEKLATKLLATDRYWLRSWTVRFLGEKNVVSPTMLATLTKLAGTDSSPEVRLQLASTAQRLKKQDVLPLLHNLMKHKKDANDRFLPLMIWLAYEPRIAKAQSRPALRWLQANAAGNQLVTNEIVPRTMRRLASTGRPSDLAACVEFLGAVDDVVGRISNPSYKSAVRRQALEGLVTALKDRTANPPPPWRRVFAVLLRDRDQNVQKLARSLAIRFQDKDAIRVALKTARDRTMKTTARIAAIQDLALVQPKQAPAALLTIFRNGNDDVEVRVEACRALASFANDDIGASLVSAWKKLPPTLRTEAVNVLSGRKKWAGALLRAVENKQVKTTELNNNTILRIRAFRDARLNERIEKVWGAYRETPAQLVALMEKIRADFDKQGGSFHRGQKVFEANCAKCHRFDGKGHDVGPNLEGAGRTIDYLLVNVLDPNRVVGQPYFTRIVVLKSGQVETGLLVAEDAKSITIKKENDVVKTYQRKDIAGKVQTVKKSVMPEGLTKNMTGQDFRDLVRYLMIDPYLIDVHVAGPFSADGVPKVNAKKPLGTTALKWIQPKVGISGLIRLPRVNDVGQTRMALVTAKVFAKKETRTQLSLGGGKAVRVWVNGLEIANTATGGLQVRPDQVNVTVALKRGLNRLLFAVRYDDATAVFFARCRDRQRVLRYELVGGE